MSQDERFRSGPLSVGQLPGSTVAEAVHGSIEPMLKRMRELDLRLMGVILIAIGDDGGSWVCADADTILDPGLTDGAERIVFAQAIRCLTDALQRFDAGDVQPMPEHLK